MSGAVQSGYRAAAEILQDLQSTALKAEDLSLIEKAHPLASSWEEHLLTMFSIQNLITMVFKDLLRGAHGCQGRQRQSLRQ